MYIWFIHLSFRRWNRRVPGMLRPLTWKRRMMVQMRPRVRRWFPSTMSWEPMFSRWTLCSLRNCRALSTFSRQWILIRPLVGLGWNTTQKNSGCLQQRLHAATQTRGGGRRRQLQTQMSAFKLTRFVLIVFFLTITGCYSHTAKVKSIKSANTSQIRVKELMWHLLMGSDPVARQQAVWPL